MSQHHTVTPNKLTGSPVEHTLNLLQQRLHVAEGETNKLAKQLENYGFKKTHHEETQDDYMKRSVIQNRHGPQDYEKVIARLCKMESLITSLTAGMESLEAEKSSSVNQLMEEKRQILENYGKELQRTRDELDKSKKSLTAHGDAKLQLEKQISKLKKDIIKRIETQKSLTEKLNEKEIELEAYETKFTTVSKDLYNEQSLRKRAEDSHSTLQFKILDLESAIDTERNNVERLNQKCISLTEDALLARGEFEKEFSCRLQYQDMMAVHEEEIKIAAENMEKYKEDNNTLIKKLKEVEEALKTKTSENESLKATVDSTTVDNDSLKQALKKAAVDNQALVKQTKEALTREQCKVDQAIQQQSKILDSAKDSLFGELEKQQKRSQNLDNENLALKDNINELTAKNSELDFRFKILEQTKVNEVHRLQAVIASAEKVKDELAKQLKQKEREFVDMNDKWMKERTTLMQKYEDIQYSLKCAEERSEKIDQEKNEIFEKLSWVNVKQHSQENIESKFAEMVSEKNKLAYEKGALLAKITTLEDELLDLKSVQDEKIALQSKLDVVNNQYSELKRSCSKFDGDLQDKSSELGRMYEELDMYKTKLANTEISLSQATCAYNEAVEETEKLIKQSETENHKHEEEILSYQSRLNNLEKERDNIAATFQSMMATNDNLQKELEKVLENMGMKDAEMEKISQQREEQDYLVDELNNEIRNLSNKFGQLENHGNTELIRLREELQAEISEKEKIQRVCEKVKQEDKNLKSMLKKLTEDYKSKDNELRGYINSKYSNLEKIKKGHEDSIEKIKEVHKKEVNNLKRQMHDLRIMSTKKEKYEDANKMALKALGEQLMSLEEDKKEYVEKNGKQLKLLDEFMAQIAELQNELSGVIQSQAEMEVKLNEKDKLVVAEKRKRRDAEQKYKVLLKGKTERDVLKERQVKENVES